MPTQGVEAEGEPEKVRLLGQGSDAVRASDVEGVLDTSVEALRVVATTEQPAEVGI